MSHTPAFAFAIVFAGVVIWFLPFLLAGWSKTTPQRRDPRARWGLVLELLAYATLAAGHWWQPPLPLTTARVVLSVFFLVLASLLSWTSTRALGRYLRIEAALDADHRLIRSGPYRVVRHPIYASMFCLMLGIGYLAATPVWFGVALLLFLAGTEIRVRVEDRLLAERFGAEFREYCRRTPAYIPMVR